MIEEADLGPREYHRKLLNEIQWLLFQNFGYDTYQKPWFQKECGKLGHQVTAEYDTVHEDVHYYCVCCGKQRL